MTNELIELAITRTGRASTRVQPEIFDQETKRFKTHLEAKEWIVGQYGKSKGKPMYIDTDNKEQIQVGKVFGFWNEYHQYGETCKWFQQDWVEFREISIKQISTLKGKDDY